MHNTFSANMLKTFEECPQKYILQYIENIQIPQTTKAAEIGKNIHALINYYFNHFDTAKIAEALKPEEKILWLNFLSLGIKKEDIYKSEYTFNIKMDETNWLTGRIDAIVKDQNKCIIYDWKTGNLPKNPETDLQTCVYLFAVYQIFKSKNLISNIEDVSFIYINLKTNERIKIQIDGHKYNNLKNNILSIIEKIKSRLSLQGSTHKNPNLKTNETKQNKQQNQRCDKCKYKTIC